MKDIGLIILILDYRIMVSITKKLQGFVVNKRKISYIYIIIIIYISNGENLARFLNLNLMPNNANLIFNI